jgi:tetratricopeptide (TPR) repeat protein
MKLSRLTLAAMVLALAAPAGAQDWRGMGRIEGRVLDANGQPIEGASVKLDLAGRGGTTLKTNKKGQWAILGVVAGNWNVEVAATGYTTKAIKVNLPSEDTRVPPVEVRLAKSGGSAGGASAEALAALTAADAAFDAGRFAEARQQYEKALADPKVAAEPSAAQALHMRLARCWSAEGNYDQEMAHLQAVLDADPANASVLSLMGQESLKAGKVDRGLELLARLDPSQVKDPDLFYNVGVMLANQQRPDKAIEYFGKAVAVDPRYVDGYFQRGLAYLGQQKLAESKADFQKVIELQPEGASADTARKALEQLPK